MGPALQTIVVAGHYLLVMLDLVGVTQVDLDVQPGHLDIGRAVHYCIFRSLMLWNEIWN